MKVKLEWLRIRKIKKELLLYINFSVFISVEEKLKMPSSKIRIAIVGGGVAGLIVARHVISRPEFYSLCLFEQTDEIGGTWVYTDETEFDENQLPIHSSMYKNLR